LKSGVPVAAGRNLTCPQCKTPFTLKTAAPEIDGPTPAVAAPARPAPPSKAVPSGPARKSRSSDEEEFDFTSKPKSKRSRDEEDEGPPRSRKRDEDEEEERPRSRKRRDEDEEEVRPRSRGRRDEDEEEDDLPSRRGRAAVNDQDEDEDESPRSRGKGKPKKKNKMVLLLVGGALLLFLLCGGGAAVMYFADPFGLFGGGPSNDMIAWAPADTQSITYINLDEARTVDDFRDGVASGGEPAKVGLRPEEISSLMMASRGGDLFTFLGNPDVVVYKLNVPADKNRMINSSGGKEMKAGSKTYYKTNSGGGLYFASSKVVVVTASESTMNTLLQKDEGKVVVSDELKNAIKSNDGTISSTSVGNAAEKTDFLGLMSGNLFGAGGFNFGKEPVKTAKARVVSLSIKVSGNRGTAKFETTYDSPDGAQTIADGLKKSMEQNKGKNNELESYDVSKSGSTVTLTLKGPIKKSKGGFPFLPGPK
jgi:hypothetical protein